MQFGTSYEYINLINYNKLLFKTIEFMVLEWEKNVVFMAQVSVPSRWWDDEDMDVLFQVDEWMAPLDEKSIGSSRSNARDTKLTPLNVNMTIKTTQKSRPRGTSSAAWMLIKS